MNQRMAITSRHKYVFNTFDYDECYDLKDDPDEMRNIAGESRAAPVVDDMRARLYELMERFGDPHSGQGPSGRFLAPRYLPRGRRLPASPSGLP